MTRQCPSCGGFCKKSGCERENTPVASDLQNRLRQGASISRDRQINLDFAKIADEAADRIDADEALMRDALYALEYAADMTKPTDLQGCDCPICTVSRALGKRLEKV